MRAAIILIVFATSCAVFGCDSPPLIDPCDEGALTGDVTVSSADDLAAIAGHTSVEGDLTISCPDCEGLTDLSCLTALGGGLIIDDSDALLDASGLKEISSPVTCLDIVYNETLADLDGLEGISSIENSLKVFHNSSLQTIEGLGGVESIGGDLEIHDNATLYSLEGLDALAAIDGDLRIFNNPNLPDCEVCRLLDRLEDWPTTVMIHSNLEDECSLAPSNCP